MTLTATGIYQDTEVDSRQDYFLGIQSRAGLAPALHTLDFFAANGFPTGLAPPAPAFIPGSSAYFSPIAGPLIPDGSPGVLYTSDTDAGSRGAFDGHSLFSQTDRKTFVTGRHVRDSIDRGGG